MLNLKEREVIKILKKGGVGVMPTDTLYGLVGGAFSTAAVNRIYKLKQRNPKKKLIVLIYAIAEIEKFNIKISKEQMEVLNKVWHGKVSVIINDTAFRLPRNKKLIEILKKTGPLVAPSANPEGLIPARNIPEAKAYFNDEVDFYLPGGTLKGKPSTLIELKKNGEIKVIRGKL